MDADDIDAASAGIDDKAPVSFAFSKSEDISCE
jgi:hypothetical protein